MQKTRSRQISIWTSFNNLHSEIPASSTRALKAHRAISRRETFYALLTRKRAILECQSDVKMKLAKRIQNPAIKSTSSNSLSQSSETKQGIALHNPISRPPPSRVKWNFTRRTTLPLSGEAIRTMNYVDDISVTLRRILSVLPMLTDEERERVSLHIRQADPSYDSVVAAFTSK
jgi:hypothetical protein